MWTLNNMASDWERKSKGEEREEGGKEEAK